MFLPTVISFRSADHHDLKDFAASGHNPAATRNQGEGPATHCPNDKATCDATQATPIDSVGIPHARLIHIFFAIQAGPVEEPAAHDSAQAAHGAAA